MIMPLTVKSFAYKGTPERNHTDAIQNLRLRLGIEVELGDKPQLLLFLTGGSEAEAITHLDPGKFQVLVSNGKTNAFASAMEVKAYSNQHGCKNVLLNLDDAADRQSLLGYLQVMRGLNNLNGKKLGLVGEVSDWLVASDVDADLMRKKLGIELIKIPWKDAGDFRDFSPGKKFLDQFPAGKHFNTLDAAKVNALLKNLIDKHSLDAITVECFSLVQENDVTACLGLSFLNDLGIPAGCEGDLCSILGMMLLKEVTGELPWMANVASVKGREVLFAHCTAPTNILSEHHINTHFETGKGTAVSGRFNIPEATVFRINNTLDKTFHAHGNVVDGIYEKNACRTQLHIEFEEEVIRELKSNPLGNHHLIIPGNRMAELEILSKLIQS